MLNVPKKMRKYLEDSSSESDEENQNPENLSESSTAQLSDCTRIKSHQSRSPIHPHKKAYQLSSPSLKGKPTTIGREEVSMKKSSYYRVS